jgi:hypothetical protein
MPLVRVTGFGARRPRRLSLPTRSSHSRTTVHASGANAAAETSPVGGPLVPEPAKDARSRGGFLRCPRAALAALGDHACP